MPNIKIEKITIPVPPLAEQQCLVAEVEALEKSIAEAQAIIDGSAAKKQAVLQRYL